MQQTTLNVLLILVIGVLISACSGNSLARPISTSTLTSTQTPQPTNTSTPTKTPLLTTTPKYFVDKNGVEMIYVSAGEFSIGDISGGGKRPAHNVYLDDYYIDKDAVNNVDFVRFLNENLVDISVQTIDGVIQDSPGLGGVEVYGKQVRLHEDLIYCIDCFGCDSDLASEADWNKSIVWDGKLFSILDGRENFPVTMVNWHGAQTYCSRRGAHLPTEAEWVKAYKGGMKRNELVNEWVFDWFAEDYYYHSPYKNPQGPEDGTFRLIVDSNPSADYMSPNFGYWNISFRCSRASIN